MAKTNNELILNTLIEDIKDIEIDAFTYFVIENILKSDDLSYSMLEDGVTDGPDDGGIDALYLFINDCLVTTEEEFDDMIKRFGGNPEFTLKAFQTCRSSGFQETKIRSLLSTLTNITTLDKNLSTNEYNKGIVNFSELFKHCFRSSIPNGIPSVEIKFYYCIGSDNEPNQKVKSLIETFKAGMDSIINSIDFKFCNAGKLVKISQQSKNETYVLDIVHSASSELTTGTVCIVPVVGYYKFLCDSEGKIKNNLFDVNIRDTHGDTEVNQSITTTLSDFNQHNRNDKFWWYNNGITIVADSYVISGAKIVITNPKIVNGLQTSHQIYNFCSKQDEQDITLDAQLLVKIIQTEDPEIRNKIIISTNRQNTIPVSQFRATDEIHKKIDLYFNSRGYYYDWQYNRYKNQQKPRSKTINIASLAQAFTSIFLSRPHKAKANPSAIIKNENEYSSIFNERKIKFIYYLVATRLIKKLEHHIRASSTNIEKEFNYLIAMTIWLLYFKSEELPDEIICEEFISLLDEESSSPNVSPFEQLFETAYGIVSDAIYAIKNQENDTAHNISLNKIVKRAESTDAIIKILKQCHFNSNSDQYQQSDG